MPEQETNETTQTNETTSTEKPEYLDEEVYVVDKTGSVVPDDDNPPPRPGKSGRPALHIDVDKLRAVASTFATYEEMAVFFGCHHETLRRKYSRIVAEGRAMGKMSIRQEMRSRSKRSDRVLIHMYEKHVEPPLPKGEIPVVMTVSGDIQRPLIIREVDETTDAITRS